MGWYKWVPDAVKHCKLDNLVPWQWKRFQRYKWVGGNLVVGFSIQEARELWGGCSWNLNKEKRANSVVASDYERQISSRCWAWRNSRIDILASFLYPLSVLPMLLMDKTQNKVQRRRSFLGHRVGWKWRVGSSCRDSYQEFKQCVHEHTCQLVNSITSESCSESEVCASKQEETDLITKEKGEICC